MKVPMMGGLGMALRKSCTPVRHARLPPRAVAVVEVRCAGGEGEGGLGEGGVGEGGRGEGDCGLGGRGERTGHGLAGGLGDISEVACKARPLSATSRAESSPCRC